MKKTLLVAALLAGFAGAASAQQAQSSLTLYGVVDIGYKVSKEGYGGRSSTTEQMSGHQSGSRFGIMGRENIGNGLTGKFMLEAGFNTDSGEPDSNGSLFRRAAWVGLEIANAGEVRLGRQEHVTSAMTSDIDPFGNSFGQAAIAADYNGANLFLPLYNDKVDNAIAYISPVWSGFQFGTNYTTKIDGQEGPTGYNDRWFGIAATYKGLNNKLFVSASFDRMIVGNLSTPAGNDGDDLDYFSLGATYDFDVVKAHFGYYRSTYHIAPAGGALGADTDSLNAFLVGVTVPFGKHNIMASYKMGSDAAGTDQDLDSIAVGYTYNFSNRTNFYASYAYTTIDGVSGGPDWKQDELAVGIRHSF